MLSLNGNCIKTLICMVYAIILLIYPISIIFAEPFSDLGVFDDIIGMESMNDNESDDIDNLNEESLFADLPSVYGASKYEQSLLDAPSAVSIITADEIRRYGYGSLAEVLNSVRGMFTTYDRTYNYANVRGFGIPGDYNSRILLLEDGHSLNDPLFEGASLKMAVDNIERIEIIRGPGSSLYGTSAFFGVINIITKQGRALSGAQLALSGASFGEKSSRLSYGDKFSNGLEVFLSANLTNSDGQANLFFPEYAAVGSNNAFYTTNNGIAKNLDFSNKREFQAVISYGDYTLNIRKQRFRKNIPTASFATIFSLAGTKVKDNNTYISLDSHLELNNDNDVRLSVAYSDFHNLGQYMLDYAFIDPVPYGPPADIVYNHDDLRGTSRSFEGQWVNTSLSDHKVIIGTAYRNRYRLYQKNYDIYGVWTDDLRSSSNWAVFIQDEMKFGDKLLITAGMRYDSYDTFGGTSNPRVTMVYKPSAITAIKLLYGSAFRAPNAAELYYSDGSTIKAALRLQPEQIKTYEAVFEYNPNAKLRLVTSIYDYQISNLITLITDATDGFLVYKNQGSVHARGIEAEIEGEIFSGWQGRISYTGQIARDRQTNIILANSPKHLAKMNISIPLSSDSYILALETQYAAESLAVRRTPVAARIVSNITISGKNIMDAVDLSLSVHNLTNNDYTHPVSSEFKQNTIAQDGRSYILKLVWQF
ncbi:MAG: TonB-dependent receptor [Mariprofundales bacterium]